MTETNPSDQPVQIDLATQLQTISQISELRHAATIAVLEAFRAEMRAEFAMLRARTPWKSA